tara:strand:- start:638 stop:1093 length:456 start_codon:yes stop_codon:yes gene_type:complete
MKIYLGADHGGFELKNKIKTYLEGLGEEVFDKGATELDLDDDYPDFIAPVARAVSEDPKGARGIVLGRSGQGEAMLANRFANVRATVYYGGDKKILSQSREHNDANILALGGDFVTEEEAMAAIKLWLSTPFSRKDRYQNRIDQAEELTKH